MKLIRLVILTFGLLLIWQTAALLTGVPPYILPTPIKVIGAMAANWQVLLVHAGTTVIEILAGLGIGTILGGLCALVMITAPILKRWLLPVLVISQAVPVFALAPILVLWFGYGMASKIAMAVLIIFFPVTSSFYYGMKSTRPELLELARIMGAGTIGRMCWIIIPGAMPSFGSGLRVAAAVAPIGAVVGEWVGSSSGLGFYMLYANARMQVDLMFAALVVLAVISLGLYFGIDALLSRLIFWNKKGEEDETNW